MNSITSVSGTKTGLTSGLRVSEHTQVGFFWYHLKFMGFYYFFLGGEEGGGISQPNQNALSFHVGIVLMFLWTKKLDNCATGFTQCIVSSSRFLYISIHPRIKRSYLFYYHKPYNHERPVTYFKLLKTFSLQIDGKRIMLQSPTILKVCVHVYVSEHGRVSIFCK